jgi:HEAT repeat protein
LLGSQTPREEVRRFVVSALSGLLEKADGVPRELHVACIVGIGLVPLSARDGWARPELGVEPASTSRRAQILFLQRVLADTALPALVRAHAPVAMARLCAGLGGDWKSAVTSNLLATLAPERRPATQIQQACAIAFGLIADADADALDERIRTELLRLSGEGDAYARYLSWISIARCAARAGEGPTPRLALPQLEAFLLDRLARANTLARPWAALALGVLQRELSSAGGPRRTEIDTALRAAMSDAASVDERAALAVAFGLSGDATAAPVLAKLLEESNDDLLQSSAAVSLGWLGARDSIPLLREVLRNSGVRAEVLKSAAIGLALMHDRELVAELVERLRTGSSLAVQSSLASALGWIGDARAIDPLLAILADSRGQPLAHAFAAVALGLLCEPGPLPWNAALAQYVVYGAAPPSLFDPSSGLGVLDIL